MAHETAKKNARANVARLSKFRMISLSIVVGCLLLDLFVVSDRSWFGVIWWFGFWAFHNVAALFFLTAVGKPTLNANGEIVECVDMSDPQQIGIYSYAQDVLWFVWVLQPLQTIISNYFLLLYLPIPMYAGYKLFTSVISPLLGARSGMMGGAGGMGGGDASAYEQQQEQQQQGRPGSSLTPQQQQQMMMMQTGGRGGNMSARAVARREAKAKK